MMGFQYPMRLLVALLSVAMIAPFAAHGQNGDGAPPIVQNAAGKAETFSYTVEWRLITAGTATLKLTPDGTAQYPSLHSELTLTSTGLVSKLYKVNDKYFGNYDPGFCATTAQMSSEEGKRRRDTRVTYDRPRKKADYLERDLVLNKIAKQIEIDIPPCVHDVLGAMLQLRTMNIDLGKSAEIPVSDGKKFANVRVEAQERENLKVGNVNYKAVRYEAFLMNGVIYPRKARLFILLSDDARRLPVQIRIRMSFPIGNVTLTLDKAE
jgi:hypothetical protein